LQLTTADLDDMAGRIQTREARFVRWENWRKSHWLVPWKGSWFPVVFDRKRQTIITFLPEYVRGEYMAEAGLL
jgi:hypothetical protein